MSIFKQDDGGQEPTNEKKRFSYLHTFFTFIKTNIDEIFQNPCNTPMMKKLFRAKSSANWEVIEKEPVDEIIFKTEKLKNRIILELMARGGMRIGEVLKLTPNDIHDRKLLIKDPKSGNEKEFIFIPQKVSDRLQAYIREKGNAPDNFISFSL